MALAIPDDDPVLRGKELLQSQLQKTFPLMHLQGDLSSDLTPNSPEIVRRKADQLKMKAIQEVNLVKLLYIPHEPLDDTVPGRLLQLAAEAVINPELLENMKFVPKWVAWWKESHRPIPYDTRLDAVRFLGYIMDRIFNRIALKRNIFVFEKNLDKEYIRAKSREIAAGIPPSDSQRGISVSVSMNLQISSVTPTRVGSQYIPKSPEVTDSSGGTGFTKGADVPENLSMSPNSPNVTREETDLSHHSELSLGGGDEFEDFIAETYREEYSEFGKRLLRAISQM